MRLSRRRSNDILSFGILTGIENLLELRLVHYLPLTMRKSAIMFALLFGGDVRVIV